MHVSTINYDGTLVQNPQRTCQRHKNEYMHAMGSSNIANNYSLSLCYW